MRSQRTNLSKSSHHATAIVAGLPIKARRMKIIEMLVANGVASSPESLVGLLTAELLDSEFFMPVIRSLADQMSLVGVRVDAQNREAM